MRAIAIGIALVLGIVLGPALAAAAPRDAEKKARAHYNTAQGFFNAGDYEHAIAEFKAAYDIDPRPRLLFNIGSAYRRRAQETGSIEDKRQALDSYRRYLQAEPKGKGADDARAYVTALESEIAAIDAAKPAPPVVPEPAPTPMATPPEPPPSTAAAPAPEPVDVSPRKSGKSYRIAGIVTAGVGVALVGAGVYFGLKARSAQDDLTALQSGGMWDQGKYNDGTSANRNMFIFLGAGGAAIAAGTIFYFVLGRDDDRRVAVVPGVGSLAVTGKF